MLNTKGNRIGLLPPSSTKNSTKVNMVPSELKKLEMKVLRGLFVITKFLIALGVQ